MQLKKTGMKERAQEDVPIMVTPGFTDSASANNNNNNNSINGALITDPTSLAMTTSSSSQPIQPTHETYQDQAQFEADKRAVYKHPLFPLLALLFEKCEMATQTAADSPISDSFHQDLEAFVQHQERDRKPFLANDPEVDGLMIKAIQVLRIHLLELDKVQELCKDFCNRYITCLKGKMQSENLLRSDYYDGAGTNSHLSSHSNSPHHSSFSSNGDPSVSPPSNGLYHHLNHPTAAVTPPASYHNNLSTLAGSHGGPPSIGNAVSLGHVSPDLHSSNSNQSSQSNASHYPIGSSVGGSGGSGIHGSTPLSQIGANTCPPPLSQDYVQNPGTPSSSVDDDEDYLGRKKPKRGVLPKQATSIMRSWLFQHIVHPYPTEDEKRQIAGQTNLTLLQVNNWFINARRRILQPMLDASNPEASSSPKVKRMKTHSSKPALKYWSDNLASLGPGQPNDGDESSEESDDMLSNDGNDLMIDNSDSSQQ